MTSRISPHAFDRLLAERGLTVTKFSELSGVSRPTLAKVRRGDPVAISTVEAIASSLQSIAARPLIGELLSA